jgi:hypothetical protein
MSAPKILDIVKGTTARFLFYRNQQMFYAVDVPGKPNPDSGLTLNTRYQFPVGLEDLAGASVFAEEKAITLMRYIRKAIEDGTFVVVI